MRRAAPTPNLPEGPVALGLQPAQRHAVGAVALGVSATCIAAEVSAESWRPDITVSLCIALTIAVAVALSPAVPRTYLYIMNRNTRGINEIRKGLAGLIIVLGSLWLGFGWLGPAGVLTVAAQIVGLHCLLDGRVIRRKDGAAATAATVRAAAAAAVDKPDTGAVTTGAAAPQPAATDGAAPREDAANDAGAAVESK